MLHAGATPARLLAWIEPPPCMLWGLSWLLSVARQRGEGGWWSWRRRAAAVPPALSEGVRCARRGLSPSNVITVPASSSWSVT